MMMKCDICGGESPVMIMEFDARKNKEITMCDDCSHKQFMELMGKGKGEKEE